MLIFFFTRRRAPLAAEAARVAAPAPGEPRRASRVRRTGAPGAAPGPGGAAVPGRGAGGRQPRVLTPLPRPPARRSCPF